MLLACGDAGAERRVLVPRDDSDSGELADGEMKGQADLCFVDERFVEERKACNADADCTLLSYVPLCCGDQIVAGISSDQLEDADKCTRVPCNCLPGVSRAEDGRVLTEGNTQPTARCIDQRCSSLVTQRQCGANKVCAANEICVTYENVPGGIPPDPDSGDNAYLTFRCEPNPCADRLDCACAQPLCDARNDAPRRCEIKNNEESDLTCSPFVD